MYTCLALKTLSDHKPTNKGQGVQAPRTHFHSFIYIASTTIPPFPPTNLYFFTLQSSFILMKILLSNNLLARYGMCMPLNWMNKLGRTFFKILCVCRHTLTLVYNTAVQFKLGIFLLSRACKCQVSPTPPPPPPPPPSLLQGGIKHYKKREKECLELLLYQSPLF